MPPVWSSSRADLSILKPKDPSHGNGVALIDIVNRGNTDCPDRIQPRARRRATCRPMPTSATALLMRQGYTLVWVGWEFDVPKRDGAIRIDVPRAAGVTGIRPRVLHARSAGRNSRSET